MTGMHPQNRRLGYARVSTVGQTLDTQLEQLRGTGCTKIYREKVTGAHSDRRELLKMLKVKTPTKIGSRPPPPLSLSLELPHNPGANPMQPPDIQAIIAAILTLAATPLQDRQPGTTPEALVVRTFTAIFQVLTGQAPQMSPPP
jgi:hypothetical protein